MGYFPSSSHSQYTHTPYIHVINPSAPPPAGWWRLQEEGGGMGGGDGIFTARSGQFTLADRPDAGDPENLRDTAPSSSSTSSSTSSSDDDHPTLVPARLNEDFHPLHKATKDWVLFSDLHCSVQTLQTCREVSIMGFRHL